MEAEVSSLSQGESFSPRGSRRRKWRGSLLCSETVTRKEGERDRNHEQARNHQLLIPEEAARYTQRLQPPPGELIIGWLLQCYGTGANSQELESKEAQQLGSLTRDWGINKRIGKEAKISSLWRQLALSVKEKYPLEKDLVNYLGKSGQLLRVVSSV